MNDTVQPEISYPRARRTPFDARRFAITTNQALIRRKAEAVAAYAAVLSMEYACSRYALFLS